MKLLLIIFFLFFFGVNIMAQKALKIKEEILEAINSTEGDFAVAFKNIETGESILINEEENFHAASTMKTPVMIEVFKQAHIGKFGLADSITVKNEFKSIVDSSAYSMDLSEDSGEKLYEFNGKKKTIYDLV